MKKTISLRIAANDKLNILKEKEILYKKIFGIIIFMVIGSMFGLALQVALISGIIFSIGYFNNQKEIKRMVETYEL